MCGGGAGGDMCVHLCVWVLVYVPNAGSVCEKEFVCVCECACLYPTQAVCVRESLCVYVCVRVCTRGRYWLSRGI